MRKSVSVLLVALVASCDHQVTGPDNHLYPPGTNLGITDALNGNGNPHFFWLAPVVAQPPASAFGAFDDSAVPTMILYCEAASDPANCPEGEIGSVVASFTLGTGVTRELEHYQLDFDTKAEYGPDGDYVLRTSAADRSDFTTYQFVVELNHDQLGTQAIGDVSFELATTGGDIKNLSTEETVALKDGRVFPLRMRIDEDALEYGVVQELMEAGVFADDPDFGVGGPPCLINCELHLIPELTEYTAYLHKPGVDYPVTGVHFNDTALEYPVQVQSSMLQMEDNTFLVIIDERVTENDMSGQENCALGIETDKWYCFRYLIHPNVQFQNPVPVGVCPEALDLSIYRLLRVDYDADENPILTRPALVDVSDFLPCQPPEILQDGLGLFRDAARSTVNWLLRPLFAQTTTRVWGGMADDFSDWFFGIDEDVPFESGLLLHYPFDGNADNIGSVPGYHGTAGSVDYTDGKFGQAILFDGTSETGVTLPGTAEVFAAGGNQWTISLWFKEDEKRPNTRLLDFRGPTQGWHTYHGVEEPDQRMITCSDGGCFSFVSDAEVWHSLVYRYAGVSATQGEPIDIFVNGLRVGQVENPNLIPLVGSGVRDIVLGTAESDFFVGAVFAVDELRVYNVAFTDAQQCTEVIGGEWSENQVCVLP
jgi:hypothetical protein